MFEDDEDRALAMNVDSYLKEARRQIDDALDSATRFGPDCPSRLQEAMRYSLLAPGKRLRPILAVLAADVVDGERRREVMSACVALEAVHAYSLIHDDLPAMDDDDLRRGRPTCHKRFDEATAILAGDALLTFAFEFLARNISDAGVVARCVSELACRAGASGMVGGQVDDVSCDVATIDKMRVEDLKTTLLKIHRRKTGALVVASLKLGAFVARATDAQIEALENFGVIWGRAFQIADDLLDYVGDEALVGKRLHKDAEKGKLTYPRVYGLDETREILREQTESGKRALLDAQRLFDNKEGLAWDALFYLNEYVARRKQ